MIVGTAMAMTHGNLAKGAPPVTLGELFAPDIEKSQNNLVVGFTSTVAGRAYQLQRIESLAQGDWTDVGCIIWGNGSSFKVSDPFQPNNPRRFYRFSLDANPSALDGLYLIPAGSFIMGDQSSPQVGYIQENPVHSLQLNAFFIAKYEVTSALWNLVQLWGLENGYWDLPYGEGIADDHPVHTISWNDAVKWCNARSEKDGLTPCYTVDGETYRTGIEVPVCNWDANGYRLPTEAEWEKAARGGATGLNFPWGNTISHSQANYFSSSSFDYDTSPTRGYHPAYESESTPYTSPVGTFPPNGYGLHDTAGNVFEWCWDYFYIQYYSVSPSSNPHGPDTEPLVTLGLSYRTFRGGDWFNNAKNARNSVRGYFPATSASHGIGLRIARSSVP